MMEQQVVEEEFKDVDVTEMLLAEKQDITVGEDDDVKID